MEEQETKTQFCANCQSITQWVKIGQTTPSGGDWFTEPKSSPLFQCSVCRKVMTEKSQSTSRPPGW